MVDYTTCGKDLGRPAAIAKLAALRAEAARRCGLDAYPAEAIADREEKDRHPYGWQMPEHGTPARYEHHGCRCDTCRGAATIRRRRYR
jgi:hypothetical protein